MAGRPVSRKEIFARFVGRAMAATGLLIAAAWLEPASAQSFLPQRSAGQLPVPQGAPAWLLPSWLTMLAAPLPGPFAAAEAVPAIIPELELDPDASGLTGLYQPGGATITATNAFFQSLGTNGRSCVTCHVPANSMGLSLATIQARFGASSGHDPLFAPVDGATCPKNVPASGNAAASAYATLLNKGLFRISLPVPASAEFTVRVVSDPYGCNTDPAYDQVKTASGAVQPLVSVYRRPLIAANLKYKVLSAANAGLFPAVDPLTGAPLPRDAQGNIENGSLMSDGREPTLSSQATDATLTHAQALNPPTAAQVAQIVQFEYGIFAAQAAGTLAGNLADTGVSGGPVDLAADPASTDPAPGAPVMTLFTAWGRSPSPSRESIARGENLFNNRIFTVSNVAGLNNIAGVPADLPLTCSGCHSQTNVGANALPVAQLDEGIGGDQWNHGGPLPAGDVPIFLLTCTGGMTTPFNGAQVLTNDPGKALITGKCSDIGRFTIPTLRGMSSRAPYFTDGSAPTLQDVVNFYDKRFAIGLSPQEQQDLVNFLASL